MQEPKQYVGHKPTAYIDPGTGEVYDFVAQPRSKSRNWYGKAFYVGMQEAQSQIADDPTLTDGDVRVLFKLLTVLQYENYLLVSLATLAEEMHRTRAGVSKSIKNLEERGIIHRGPKMGRSYSYRLDPEYAFKGNANARDRVQKEISDRNWTVLDGGNTKGKK